MNERVATATPSYEGAENLEVMLAAENYNEFLTNLVARWCGLKHQLLDFGAGTGTFARMLRDKGYEVYCVELDQAQAHSLKVQAFRTATSTDGIPDNSIKYIYTLNVLEHIDDDQSQINEFYRILAPCGIVIAYVPAFKRLFGAMDRKVGHFRRYTRRNLCGLFRQAGFEILELTYADSLGFFVTLVFNQFSRSDGVLKQSSVRFYDRVIFPASRLCDLVFSKLFGKNVYVVAKKPDSSAKLSLREWDENT